MCGRNCNAIEKRMTDEVGTLPLPALLGLESPLPSMACLFLALHFPMRICSLFTPHVLEYCWVLIALVALWYFAGALAILMPSLSGPQMFLGGLCHAWYLWLPGSLLMSRLDNVELYSVPLC